MAIYLGIRKKNIGLAGAVCQQAYKPIPIVPLVSIEVTAQPTKTVYKHGENFSSVGMVITATYEDGSTKTVYDYVVANRNNLVAGTTSLTISYTDGSVTKETTTPITVKRVLSKIAVTTAPTKTIYGIGENFDSTGMVVTATYTDGSINIITNYTISNGNNLTIKQNTINISYIEDGVTKTTTQPIFVKSLKSIVITAAPTKTIYGVGESFDSTGMVVAAMYTDGSTKNVSNYTVINGNNLTMGQTYITISYTEDDITATITQAIFVKRLNSIAVTTAPTKTIYNYGDNFDSSGMVVTATYTDNSTKTVTGYTITNGSNLAYGKSSVTISYTEDGMTKTTTQSITVKDTTAPSLSVTAPPSSTKGSSITISGTATDAGSGISSVTVTVGSTNYNASVSSNGSWSVSVSLATGYNSISVVAKDKEDNTSSSSTYTVKRLEFVTVYDWGTFETDNIPLLNGYYTVQNYSSLFPSGWDRCDTMIVNGVEYDVVYSIDGSYQIWKPTNSAYPRLEIHDSSYTYLRSMTLYFRSNGVYTAKMGYYQ